MVQRRLSTGGFDHCPPGLLPRSAGILNSAGSGQTLQGSGGRYMILRTTVAHATFRRAFKLPDMRDAYPPGTYVVETEEERLETLSFLAFRRVATRLHLTKSGVLEVLPIDPRHLAEALARDAAAEAASSD